MNYQHVKENVLKRPQSQLKRLDVIKKKSTFRHDVDISINTVFYLLIIY